jgi:hypothetical protein
MRGRVATLIAFLLLTVPAMVAAAPGSDVRVTAARVQADGAALVVFLSVRCPAGPETFLSVEVGAPVGGGPVDCRGRARPVRILMTSNDELSSPFPTGPTTVTATLSACEPTGCRELGRVTQTVEARAGTVNRPARHGRFALALPRTLGFQAGGAALSARLGYRCTAARPNVHLLVAQRDATGVIAHTDLTRGVPLGPEFRCDGRNRVLRVGFPPPLRPWTTGVAFLRAAAELCTDVCRVVDLLYRTLRVSPGARVSGGPPGRAGHRLELVPRSGVQARGAALVVRFRVTCRAADPPPVIAARVSGLVADGTVHTAAAHGPVPRCDGRPHEMRLPVAAPVEQIDAPPPRWTGAVAFVTAGLRANCSGANCAPVPLVDTLGDTALPAVTLDRATPRVRGLSLRLGPTGPVSADRVVLGLRYRCSPAGRGAPALAVTLADDVSPAPVTVVHRAPDFAAPLTCDRTDRTRWLVVVNGGGAFRPGPAFLVVTAVTFGRPEGPPEGLPVLQAFRTVTLTPA